MGFVAVNAAVQSPSVTLATPPSGRRVVIDSISLSFLNMPAAGTCKVTLTPAGASSTDCFYGTTSAGANTSVAVHLTFPQGLQVESLTVSGQCLTGAGVGQNAGAGTLVVTYRHV